MNPANSVWTAARLMLRARLRRLINRLAAARRRGKDPPGRRGTAGKREGGVALGALLGILFLLSATSMSVRAFDNVVWTHARNWLPGEVLPRPAASYLSVEVMLVLLSALMLALANKEIAASEWDLEWLATLPAPTRTLLLVRVLERTLINPFGTIALLPFLSVLAYRSGHGNWSPVVGAVLALPLLALAAAAQTVVDTGFRLRLSPSRLRNLQALFTIVGTISMYLCIAPTMNRSLSLQWPARLPAWAFWTPPGLAVRALTGPNGGRWLALLAAELLALVLLAVAWLEHELRQGVVAAGARERSGRRPPLLQRLLTPAGSRVVAAVRPGWLSPVQRRELKLLGRDRNFLVQTTVTPLLVVGFQLALTVGVPGSLSLESVGLDHLAALGFGVAAYTLMFSAFQTLNNEGGALWLLYTMPRPLSRVLLDKALLWGALAVTYPLVLFGAAAHARPQLPARAFILLAIALLGVPIYALIATSLGVFGANPLAQEVQRKVRPAHAYLYLLLASLYTFAIYATDLWQRGALLALTLLLALALWQKARDRLPFLLDPTAAPPPRVSLADGMLAAVLFFVVQAVVAMLFVHKRGQLTGTEVLIAFVVAGAVASVGTRLTHRLTGAQGVPRLLGPRAGRAALLGVAGGLVAALAGAGYLLLVLRFPGLKPWLDRSQLHLPQPGPWLVLLAVVAAPVFEETIFRGLVFGGLRRSVRFPWAALASAAIFAVVHPPIAVAPVFVLALVAAFVYERTGMLMAPMLTHAVYNGLVLSVSLR